MRDPALGDLDAVRCGAFLHPQRLPDVGRSADVDPRLGGASRSNTKSPFPVKLWTFASQESDQVIIRKVKDSLDEACRHERDAAGRLRTLARDLRPPLLDQLGLLAAACRLRVTVHFGSGELMLTVADDGKGFQRVAVDEFSSDGHLGLLGMTERARLLGGHLEVRSAPGEGTVVEASLPLATP